MRPSPSCINVALALALATSAMIGCQKSTPTAVEQTEASASAAAANTDATIDPSMLAMFRPPLPAAYESKDNPLTEEKIKLGRMLYFDPRLSLSKKISCNSCHLLDKGGDDDRRVSLGHEDQPGKRNSPTVYNAAGHFAQFWDGRAKDVEEQAKGPILNPIEMGMPSDNEAVAQFRLESSPEYVAYFKAAFPGEANPVTFDNIARAIAAFERKLTTPSRWDKLLGGDATALTDDEKRGFKKFMDTGCMACHMGTLVGGGMYQKLGLAHPWPDTKDEGRFEVTKSEADKMLFKVPSLRNVEKTAPYFHDGSVQTLEEAVKLMAHHQLGKELSPADIASIVTWLKSLTGTVPADYIKKPDLPPMKASTLKTPATKGLPGKPAGAVH